MGYKIFIQLWHTVKTFQHNLNTRIIIHKIQSNQLITFTRQAYTI